MNIHNVTESVLTTDLLQMTVDFSGKGRYVTYSTWGQKATAQGRIADAGTHFSEFLILEVNNVYDCLWENCMKKYKCEGKFRAMFSAGSEI